MLSRHPAVRSQVPSAALEYPYLGDDRPHRIRIAGVHLVAYRELRGDLSRGHLAISEAQHVEDGSAALAARNGRRFLAPEYWPDRVRLRCRLKNADRAVKASDIRA